LKHKEVLSEMYVYFCRRKVKGKVILVTTSRRGPQGCETSRLPYFLDNRLTDGGEDVSLTHRLVTLYPPGDSWYSLLFEAKSAPGP
jgi:hypothetical protein